MPVPTPSVPTRLPDVQVASGMRAGVAVAQLIVAADDDHARLIDGSELPPTPAEVTGKPGEIHTLTSEDVRWLVGIGSDVDDPKAWRQAAAALARAVAAHADDGPTTRAVQVEVPPETSAACVAAFTIGARLGAYAYQVSESDSDPTVDIVVLVVDPAQQTDREAVVADAAELAAATALARDLANTPSNVKNPEWLGATAAETLAGAPDVTIDVHNATWLAENGFGGILAVGGGSASPPVLIEMRYRPPGADKHILLVGKGITFDTGGISIKPADGMHLMRTDMSGGAAVIGALRAIAALRLPVTVTALVPSAENHVSGSAYRPGDIVRHYGGITSEISNTDAEGRIVLADALVYGIEQFEPDAVVDVATLTGAMKVALGLRTGAVFSDDDSLASALVTAGATVGEALWRMPLSEAHADAVVGELGDVQQAPKGPGGITAALFLREFAKGAPWAHLDIAGPARAESVYDEVSVGGTGFAARTLVEYVRQASSGETSA